MGKGDFFSGKKVFITGGSSGIGLSLARQLVGKGADVWLVARNSGKLSAAAKELKKLQVRNDQIVGVTPADVSVEAQVKDAVARAEKGMGFPDIVINDAGISHPGYFQEQTTEIFHSMMDVNFFGTLHVTRAVVPGMIERRKGHIVNVSSGVAFLAVFGYSAYGASKWAVRGLTDTLRGELKQYGIRFSIAFPPDTDTPQLAAEAAIKPLETKIISSTNKVYSPEAVARDILSGIEHNRYIIITGLDTNFFYHLSNFMGPRQYGLMDMFVSDAVSKAKKQKSAN